ncbi:MAG: DUF1015 domain-containing protein [Actinobacteria bacterium]|jgi:uncharacterized protein (DUF1015 family)|nr:DUF1015 domain-containing protein [Actinomycetota bacterium]MBT3747220.1 DUF1015 domain-containing protein [Actinomycetota bacterium]MBT3970290.1 DUF1015 domain-containing protein [Actinomycetota bacterium]MBT4009960.1 DUF1015 domain-containing protein [Actinomycetota bacterium]MBT4303597.1 DUF1015 domain-containing protein [Actinomycetota bacterium]
MSVLRPFPGLLIKSEWADRVTTGPYDAYSPAERVAIIADNPYSFLYVTRSREDLPLEQRDDIGNLLTSCAEAMQRLHDAEAYRCYDELSLFLYRMTIDGHQQTGIMGLVPVTEDDDRRILRHEAVRPGRTDLLARHLVEVGSSSSPVSLTYRSDSVLEKEVQRLCGSEPDLVSTSGGVDQEVWVVSGSVAQNLADLVGDRTLYVTDGHHRLAAAATARELFDGAGGPLDWTQVVLFPDSEMLVLPFHRRIHDRQERTAQQLFADLETIGTLTPKENAEQARPEHGQVGIFINGSWFCMDLPAAHGVLAVDQLDVSRLQHGVLNPVYDIKDPGNDPSIDYLPEPVGLFALETRCLDDNATGFVMHPTSVAELMAVADAGERMPPKSSYFEPKPQSGVFIRCLDREPGWEAPYG